MTSKQLDRLLEQAVASALGVPVPRKRRRIRAPRLPLPDPRHAPSAAAIH